jgi:TetR/AcrR family transcriptional regulator, cholesterol catabolism regulator
MANVHHQTVTLTRRFSHAQSAKRSEARRVAAQLATAGGYEAVTMGAVADRIGIARATVYRYFSSKDHLLAEIMEEWTARINADLRRNPPPGKTLADRIGAAFERIIETAARNPGLTSAMLLSATSSDPAAADAFPSWSAPVAVYLKTLVGQHKVDQFDEIVTVLSYVLFSALIATALRGRDPSEAAQVLRTTVRLLLGGRH